MEMAGGLLPTSQGHSELLFTLNKNKNWIMMVKEVY